MTPTAVSSNMAPTLSSLSGVKADAPQPEEVTTPSQIIGEPAVKDNKPVSEDKINISDLSRQAAIDAQKKEALVNETKKQDAKRDETSAAVNNAKPAGAIAKVQFVYNPKGDLSIRYMDTASRVVYQVPSELMMRLTEAASKSDSSVDMKA
jgi:hypothetical protein